MIAINDMYPTIQGEGCLTGTPMMLIRLHGCDVGCPFCDTRETWHVRPEFEVETIDDALGANQRWAKASATDIAKKAASMRMGCKWALLTGGEPAQQELQLLSEELHHAGFRTALETSGTARGHLEGGSVWDWVCVSPKIAMPGGKTVLPDVVQRASELKMVIGKPRDLEVLLQLIADTSYRGEVCLQPMSENRTATALCVSQCLAHGWRLSIQTHKLIDVR